MRATWRASLSVCSQPSDEPPKGGQLVAVGRWSAKAREGLRSPALGDHSTTGYRRAEQSGMDGCCDPRGCVSMFGAGYAREQARCYRRRGLGVAERDIVDFLSRPGLGGATILEIGGRIGEIRLELLLRRAARATNLELVGVYDSLARALADRQGR